MSDSPRLTMSVSSQVANAARPADIHSPWTQVIALAPAAITFLAVVTGIAGPISYLMFGIIVGAWSLASLGAAMKDRRHLENQRLDRPPVAIWWGLVPTAYLLIRGIRFRELESSFTPLALNVVATPPVLVLADFSAGFVVMTHSS